MLLGVDVVLGPLLTLIVYKQGKKSLRFDLTVIVVLQLIAFSYGMSAVARGRPAWLVFNADRFDLVAAQDTDPRHAKDSRPEYRTAPWTGPRWVASRNPDNVQARNTLLLESARGGPDLPQRTDLYLPLASDAAAVRARAKPLAELERYNTKAAVAAVEARWPEATAWLPLMAKAQPMTVLLRASDASVVAVVDLRPWP